MLHRNLLRHARNLTERIARAGAITSIAALCIPAIAAGSQDEADAPAAEVVRGAEGDPATQPRINSAIDKGVQFLLAQQQLDGSWRPNEHRYVSGQTGLCLYTLLKAGLKPSHPAIQRGVAFVRAHPPRWTYGISCCMLAFETADPLRFQDDIRNLSEALLECQGRGFSYPGGHEDLSLTQYGCLGLRAAEKAGIEVPLDVWESLLDYLESVQGSDGSFTYRPNTDETGSMTAAGIVALEICREAIKGKKETSNRTARLVDEEVDELVKNGIEWLGRNMRVDKNPDPGSENDSAGHMTRWRYYYLYGLERVGGLTGEKMFGPHDWYQLCATHLVNGQNDKGAWTTPHGEAMPSTCFAILVLKRATAPTTGAQALAVRSYGDDSEKRALNLRVTGDQPLNAWISSWGDRTRETFEWDGERRKGPRVWRVEYIDADSGEVLATADGNGDEPAKANRFAAQIRMAQPGDYRLFCRAVLRPIDDEDGEEVTVKSQTLKVRVDAVMTAAMEDAMRDLTRNELTKTRADVSTSTEANAGHAPHFATDGTTGHGWLSANDDAEPWLLVELARPQRATHVVITPHLKSPREPGIWGRPKRVSLRVNGKTAGEFDLVTDPMAKTYMPLKKRTTIREVKIEVLERFEGTGGGFGKAVGIAEIELQLRPDYLKEQQRAKRDAERDAKRKRSK